MDKTKIIEREPRGPVQPKETHRFVEPGEYDKVTNDLGNLWVRHPIPEPFQHALKNKKNRDSYEDFVYGFMYHFDNHSPERWNKLEDGVHKIYFKWYKSKDKSKYESKDESMDESKDGIRSVDSVDIYIIPKPKKPFNVDSKDTNPGVDPEKPPAPPPPPSNA